MRKVFTILAHVDAGKTTFAEQLLFHRQVIRKAGRVDHKNTFLDNDEIERERGITVFSSLAKFSYEDDVYYLIDTPGHMDFTAETERGLGAADYGIMLVNAAEGIQGHTDTLWHLAKQQDLPLFFFLNKTDLPGVDMEELICSLHKELSEDIILFPKSLAQAGEEFWETIAERDEDFLEMYLEGKRELEKLKETVIKLILERKLFPAFSGSALQDEGVFEFFALFHQLTRTDTVQEEAGAFSGYIYQVRHENGRRICYIKVLEGTLSVKEEIKIGDSFEKINELMLVNGKKQIPVQKVQKGDICAATGILKGTAGMYIGGIEGVKAAQEQPLLSCAVIYQGNLPVKTVLGFFKILEDEDPLLRVSYEPQLEEICVSIMGKIQLEVLTRQLKERFGLEVDFAPPKILYKETLKEAVIGRGHYEPLRHYAEVHFLMEPAPGEGIAFLSDVHVDLLAKSWQNLIRTHLFEKEHKGVLLGMPLEDVRFTLKAGRAHLKHTEGGDFREAVYRAVRQGLMKGQCGILEPFYSFRIYVPPEFVGKVLSDIQRMHGKADMPQADGTRFLIAGTAPASEFMNYAGELTAFTSGKGRMAFRFGGYQPCHNEKEVIENSTYEAQRDLENTADSVFCSHGAGFCVKWNEADEYMHCGK